MFPMKKDNFSGNGCVRKAATMRLSKELFPFIRKKHETKKKNGLYGLH